MESSSEDSFAWTNTTSDESESEAMANEEESDFDKKYKKKLQKELFINGDLDGSQEETPRSKKKKKIKREKGSPVVPVKQESDSDARLSAEAAVERALRVKAEQELAGDRAPRKRRRSHAADSAASAASRDEPDVGEPPPRKKKKHKREINGIEPIVDKFEAEETVVESRRKTAPAAERSAPAEKPFTSKEFVDTDSDSDAPGERRAPPAPREPPARRHSEKSDVEIVMRSPERSPKRSLKIRERITYEEESQDRREPESEDEPQREAAPAPAGERLARYLRSHAHLQPAAAGERGAAPSADEDVWLVRAPGSLRAAALAGAALALDARCKLKADGVAYEAAPAACAPRAALLLDGAGWRVRGVRVRGALQLRARVPRVRAPPASPGERAGAGAVPLPATRARHPLLGADWERAPRPPRARTHTDPPCSVALDAPDRHEKKKKKKKEKRKRERSEADGANAGGDARSPSPLPRARGAGGTRGAGAAGELWDSAAAIEESLFNF